MAAAGDRAALVDALSQLAQFAMSREGLVEVELNPVFVLEDGISIIDALLEHFPDPTIRTML